MIKNKTIITLILSLLFSNVYADGGPDTYVIGFSIEQNNNHIIHGYSTLYEGNFVEDSLNKQTYLLKVIVNNNSDSISYYEDLIDFNYLDIRNDNELTQYFLIQESSIDISTIKNITIDTLFKLEPRFRGDLKTNDTIWISSPPIKKIGVDGFLCYFQIFVFEESNSINQYLNKINQLKKLNTDLKAGITNSIFKTEDDLEQQYFLLFKELEKHKVIVIDECSC